MEFPKRITISGYYGYGNLGDEAILEAMIASLENRFGSENLEIVVLSNNPERTEREHGVSAVYRWNPVLVPVTIKNSEVLISGGGGLLQDRTSSFSLWYYLALIYFARIVSVPTYVLGQGIGPIRREYNKFLLRTAAPGIKGVLTRDQKSIELMDSLGIDEDRLIAGDDLAFLLDQDDNKQDEYLNSPDKEIVAAALRSDINGRKDVLRAVSSGLDMLYDKFEINIVLFSTNSLSDEKMNNDLQGSTEAPCRILDVDHLSPDQLVKMMQGLDLVIGGRLHTLIFSLLSNTPIQGISYDPKMDHLIKKANKLNDNGSDFSLWHPDELVNATEYLSDLESSYREREQLKKSASKVKEKFTRKADKKLDLALGWLEEDLFGGK